MTGARLVADGEGRPYSPQTLAERWGCGESTVRNLIRRNELATFRIGTLIRISAEEVEHGAKQVGSIKKAFQAASARSGVDVTPYTLRHTGAVWAAEAGVPMAEIAQFMGHDDDRTTSKHYSRFSPGYLAGVANAIRRQNSC